AYGLVRRREGNVCANSDVVGYHPEHSAAPAPPTSNPQDLWRSGYSIACAAFRLAAQTPHATGSGQQNEREKVYNPILVTATESGWCRRRPGEPPWVRVDPSKGRRPGPTPSSPVPSEGHIGGSGWKTFPGSTGPQHKRPRCFP